jgi:hypothetical protein
MTAIAGWFLGSRIGRSVLLYGSIALSVVLFLLYLRKSGERAGRAAERVATQIKVLEVKDAQLKAGAAAPRDAAGVVDRMRNAGF